MPALHPTLVRSGDTEATSTLALYNACELAALIFTTFKHWNGLYFWTLFLTTLGIFPYALGWLLGYLDIVDSYRAVLWMIVINGTTWHTTQTTLLFTIGPNVDGDNPNRTFVAIEKTQMTFFCAQEFVISGLYLWGTIDILKTSLGNKQKTTWYLLIINLLIVAMDVALLIIMYKDHYTIEQGVKLVIYSIKLKLEFAVLGKLVDVAQSRGGSTHTPAFIEMSAPEQGRREGGQGSDGVPEIVHLEDNRPRRMADEEGSMSHLYDDAMKQIYGYRG
ncbi:hypothetical protein F53441_3407 [Fusarium austroafricanum]|uniref:DUF7703 domain-containing protein n=1 Tax=Fusarium austroafricanum TaxID=2364996 RepID=A0A8H4P1V5_9HYPO|nr:hypothetical protein F53441_3407 [Fusarium austroafricanum]